MFFQEELIQEIKNLGAEFFRFVDVSKLSVKQNKRFPVAVLLGVTLTPDYLLEISDTPDFVPQMIAKKQIETDEFHLKELGTDRMADALAEILSAKGYAAYSQSENNIFQTGFYDVPGKQTPLPHKTIAGMAGLGWVGKHNLLVTPEFGSAVSMCSVLTNAPLETVLFAPADPRCGTCNTCVRVCSDQALNGNAWHLGCSRDELVDVLKCTTCLQCLVHCPWTQKYAKRALAVR